MNKLLRHILYGRFFKFLIIFSMGLLTLFFLQTHAALAKSLPSSASFKFVYSNGGDVVNVTAQIPGHQTQQLSFQYGTYTGEGKVTGWAPVGSCNSACIQVVNYLTHGTSPVSNQPASYYLILEGAKLAPYLQFIVNNSNTYKVPVTGASTLSGTPQWLNGAGEPVKPSNNELEFISPQVIYDTYTMTYYLTDSSLFSNGGQRFMNDGDTLYWPSTGVMQNLGGNTECLGGLNVVTSSRYYVRVYLVPTFYVNGVNSCVFGSQSNLLNVSAFSNTINVNSSSYWKALGIVPISGQDNIGEHINVGNTNHSILANDVEGGNLQSGSVHVSVSSQAANLEFSMFYWENSSTLGVFGNSTQLTAQPSSTVSNILSNISGSLSGGTNANNYKVFTTNACTGQGNIYYPFLLVTYNPLSSNFINSQFDNTNAKAYIYNANNSNSGWSQLSKWNGKDVNCLLGGSAPSENHTQENTNGVPDGGSQSYTYISYISQSNSKTSLAPSNTTTTPPPNQNLTCETSLTSPLTWLMCPFFNTISDFSNWFLKNVVQPMLVVQPINLTPGSSGNGGDLFTAWSDFRDYGDAVLLIALLVAIIVEAAGGGAIQAYTIRKMLPRILIAAILLNLSIYIVAAGIDITNIIGHGISQLLTEPFKNSGLFNFRLSGTQQVGALGIGIIGAFMSGASIAGFILSFLGGIATATTAALTAAFFVLLPIILGIFALWVTLIIRQGVIILLVIFSPIAFALYCLPNTEQYFKRWWKLLAETLLIYPIIMIIAAVADILSMTTLQGAKYNASTGSLLASSSSAVAAFTALILQFLPLLAAPFAFRIAGGTLGKVNEFLNNGAQRLNKMAENRRAIEKRKYAARALQGRQRAYSALQTIESNRNRSFITRGLARFGAGRVGGYNIEQAMSATRAEWGKEVNDQIATGKDDEVRGLTVNKAWALSKGEDGEDYRVNSDGTRQFRTLGGAWVDEAAVDAGYRRWGSNTFAQQAALSYEMRKANDEFQTQRVASRYQTLTSDDYGSWRMSRQQSQGVWQGAAFENQNQHLEYKYTNSADGSMSIFSGGKGEDFVNEIYEKRGSYNLAQMNSNTVEQLKRVYDQARDKPSDSQAEKVRKQDIREKIEAIAESFMQDTNMRQIGTGENEQPIQAADGTVRRQVSTPGASHMAERVRELASEKYTGVINKAPEGLYNNPRHAPSSNNREQKY